MAGLWNWGARADERRLTLPCDALLPQAPVRLHRAVSVAAPPTLLYAWCCQLRRAPYSYDWIDNRGRRSPQELESGATDLVAGERFLLIMRLVACDAGRSLTMSNQRTAVTYDITAEGTGSRLYVRMLFAPPGGAFGARLLGPPLAAGDLLMMRRQLLNLRHLAERDAARPSP